MKFASLFAGIGGFDLGFERAYHTCLAQVELNDKARVILNNHWPDTKKFVDVQDVTGDDLGPVQLISGGFPCQDVSLAGRRAGLAGAKSGLFWEFSRLVDECHPKWFVIENVPGLLSSNGGRDMGTVLRRMGELGYGWAYRVLDSQHFGLAQRRKRVFIVGNLGDWRASAEVLFEPESLSWVTPESRTAEQDIASTLGGGTEGGGPKPDSDRMTFVTVGTLTATGLAKGGERDDLAQAGHVIPFDKTQITSPDNRSQPEAGDPAPTLAAANKVYAAIGFNHLQDPIPTEELSPVLGAKSEGMGVHDGTQVRRLTPVECERLQGFPDGWTAGVADSHRYRTLGNAVSVPVARWIGKRIHDKESETF